jgi:HEAT repeat protein
MTGNLFFLLAFVLFFRSVLETTESKWPVMFTFIWLEVVTVLVSLEFWGLSGRIFNVRQGKRLFGLIGSGEIVAGILAGISAGHIAVMIGTENLLLFTAAALAASIVVLRYIIQSFPEAFVETEEQGAEEEEAESLRLKDLLGDNYIRLILGISAVSVLGFYFVDFAFYAQADVRYQSSEALARFFGLFFAVSGIFNLAVSSLFSGRLLNRYGLKLGLLALPVVLIFGSGGISVTGTFFAGVGLVFWLVVLTKLFDDVIRSAIEEPSILILYQPLPVKRRLGVQIYVESIIEPVAMGVAGGMLLGLTKLFQFSAVHAAWGMVAILTLWTALSVRLRSGYTEALLKALKKRLLGGVSLTLDDASSIEIFKRRLDSHHTGEVIYSLNLLEDVGHETLGEFLAELIDHSEPIVRQDVLKRIARRRVVSLLDSIALRVEKEEDPEVRGEAIKTLCELGETDVFDVAYPYLKDPSPPIRKGAMVGLLRSGGIEGILAAGELLTTSIHSPNHEDRCFAAQVLGEIEIRQFYRPLVQLLEDSDIRVKKTALEAAGKLGNPRLWPWVIDSLGLPEVREVAASTLIAGGESVVHELEESFLRENQSSEVRARIIKITAKISQPSCIEFLLKHIDFPQASLRHQVLIALADCGFRGAGEREKDVLDRIFHEIRSAVWTLGALADIGKAEEESFAALSRALVYELDRNIDRVVLLLSFIYPKTAIFQARSNLNARSLEKKAYAFEIFDNLLSRDLKDAFLPLIDTIPIDQQLKRLERIYSQRSKEKHERLPEIISRSFNESSAWSKTCALYTIGRTSMHEYTDVVMDALAASNEMIRETAVWALGRLHPDDLVEQIKGLLNDSSKIVAGMCRYVLNHEYPKQH